MLEKRWATPQDKHDIIDFIDFVFSKAHRPHDFATLLPSSTAMQPIPRSIISLSRKTARFSRRFSPIRSR